MSGGLDLFVGGGDRLAQVFMNLLDNAIKYSPRDGAVRVPGENESGWISIHADGAGPGIPEGHLSRIFERFYQLEKARSGGAGGVWSLGWRSRVQLSAIIPVAWSCRTQRERRQGPPYSSQLCERMIGPLSITKDSLPSI
jgi:hypothetical protein